MNPVIATTTTTSTTTTSATTTSTTTTAITTTTATSTTTSSTTVSTTTASTATTTSSNGGNNGSDGGADGGSGSNGGGVEGDPHFSVSFSDKPDLCFDYNAGNGTVFDILRDLSTGLAIQGLIIQSGSRTHFSNRLDGLAFKSPAGVEVKISNQNVKILHHNSIKTLDLEVDRTLVVSDVETTIYSRQRMRHRTVSIKIGPSTFSITVKSEKKSMKFHIDEWNRSVTKLDGLLGFVMANSYKVSENV